MISTVRQPGLTPGEFDTATSRHGLATTLGVVSMTGIAGLTLGGGIGWLHGECDRLRQPKINQALRPVQVAVA